MASIAPIATNRTSDILVRTTRMTQLQVHQQQLLMAEYRLSTGRKFALPSDDPSGAQEGMALMSLRDQNAQFKKNVDTADSYMQAMDAQLSSVSDGAIEVRSYALQASGNLINDTNRAAIAQQINGVIEATIGAGNHRFLDRYLFSGSNSENIPYVHEAGGVAYYGNDQTFKNIADTDMLTPSSVTGETVFGVYSPRISTMADLDPDITPETLLRDLDGGEGVTPSAIQIADGASMVTVDLSGAETVADIIQIIEGNPPDGRTLDVTLGADGLVINMDAAGGGNLTVQEVGIGTTAAELGILDTVGVGTGPLNGGDLDPQVTLSTQLDDILGGAFDKASGIQVNNGDNQHVITFDDCDTIEDMLNKINGTPCYAKAEISADGTGIDIRSYLSGTDFSIGENGGTTATQLGIRTLTGETSLDALNYGRGIHAEDGTDFTIIRRDGVVLAVDVSNCDTIDDVIDAINNHVDNTGAGTLTVRLKAFGNGIEIEDLDGAAGGGDLTVRRESENTIVTELGFMDDGVYEVTADAGSPDVLRAADTNPYEVKGLFNTLLRMEQAVLSGDQIQLNRTSAMLEEDLNRVLFTQSENGIRMRNIDSLRDRLEEENLEVEMLLSEAIEIDMVTAASEWTAAQTAYQAALQSVANAFQLSLLDFI